MVEKKFEKTYSIGHDGLPKSGVRNASKRIIADYSAVFGVDIPDDIKDISEKIKRGEESESYNFEYSWEADGVGEKIYDKVKYDEECNAIAFWDEDDYGDPIYRVEWYFFSSEYYTKRIGNKIIKATSYTDILKKTVAAKGKYRYFCVHRPPSPGGIPDGYISYDSYSQGHRYCGEVSYNVQLSEYELSKFGLVVDENWDRIRKVYLEE